MNYRITQEFKPPFTINTLIEEAGSLKVLFIGTVLYCGYIMSLFK